jgi:hypothetical protein
MKKTINLCDFRQEFETIRPNNFSYEGIEILYDFLIQDEDFENELELDVIAFCCEYVEMSQDEIIKQYPQILEDIDEENPKIGTYELIWEYLHKNTIICGETRLGTIIFSQF